MLYNSGCVSYAVWQGPVLAYVGICTLSYICCLARHFSFFTHVYSYDSLWTISLVPGLQYELPHSAQQVNGVTRARCIGTSAIYVQYIPYSVDYSAVLYIIPVHSICTLITCPRNRTLYLPPVLATVQGYFRQAKPHKAHGTCNCSNRRYVATYGAQHLHYLSSGSGHEKKSSELVLNFIFEWTNPSFALSLFSLCPTGWFSSNQTRLSIQARGSS